MSAPRTMAFAGRCLSAILCLLPAWAPAADERPSNDRLLPPETYLFVTCPDVDTLKERFADSGFGRLWSDPAMQAFRGELESKFEENASEIQEKLGVPLMDVLKLPKGQATFAIAKAGSAQVGVLIMADIGDDTETLEALLDKVDSQLEENNAEKTIETVDGVDISIFQKKADSDDADNSNKSLSYFVNDGVVAISSSSDLLKAVLERWDGAHSETFAENQVYQQTISTCRESADVESDLYTFIDPVGLTSAVLAANPSMAMAAAMFPTYLPLVGLDGLKGIGGASSFVSDEFGSVTRTLVTLNGPLTGIPKVLRMPARQQAPPAWVDEDVEQYTSISWDPPGAYAAIRDMYETMTGQKGGFDAMMDQAANHPANPGIHPKKDIFDQMTGIVHVVASPSPGDDVSGSQQVLFVLGIKDDVQMQSLLEKIAGKSGGAMVRRDFEGSAIYDIGDSSSNAPGSPSPAVAVSRGFLFIATHVPVLEEALRGGTSSPNPLKDSEDYRSVSRHFPSQVSVLSFSKAGAGIGAIWEQARSGALNDQFGDFDFTTLPEFESVKKYFAPTGSYAMPHEKGAIFVQFALPVD